MASSNASLSYAQIASARVSPAQPLFFQLYKHRDDKIAETRVREVVALGYNASFLTVDAIVAGNRERDIRAPFELEEQEARRLQSKARETMDDDDFGLADVAEEEAEDLLEEEEPVAPELPQDKLSLLRHIAKTSPETLALANDWEDTAARVVRAQEKLQKYVTCTIFSSFVAS